ncbi:MAG: hypothetical protein ACRYGA_02090 [Janthinobacterium lividum]
MTTVVNHRERPILFSAPMVRMLLAGTKTQTRRAVAMPRKRDSFVLVDLGNGWWPYQSDDGESHSCDDGMEYPYSCPYGQPGQRIWVREAFRLLDSFDGDSPSRVGERCIDAGYRKEWAPLQFEADGERRDWMVVGTPTYPPQPPSAGKLRPSIHIPRWASRITLEITDVRVERLQDISRGDAMAEGCPFPNMAKGDDPCKWYAQLWDQINGAGAWDANPWVWAVSFKHIEGAKP